MQVWSPVSFILYIVLFCFCIAFVFLCFFCFAYVRVWGVVFVCLFVFVCLVYFTFDIFAHFQIRISNKVHLDNEKRFVWSSSKSFVKKKADNNFFHKKGFLYLLTKVKSGKVNLSWYKNREPTDVLSDTLPHFTCYSFTLSISLPMSI